MERPVLSVRGLTTSFKLRDGWFPAIKDVSFDLGRNETLALVGESGCGKSITAMSIMRLLTESKTRRFEGQVLFDGKDLLKLGEREMRRLRGSKLAMIFQEPMTSLNPVLPIGQQVGEPLIYHRGMTRKEADEEALRLLDVVKIPDARHRLGQYPHQFSGGMRQRVMIAMALACRPAVLFADEPTTALDVTIQAQVLALLDELRGGQDLSMILITHDLGVVASIAARVAVMYGGEIIEMAACDKLFAEPTHPYTEALLRSIPRSDADVGELVTIDGQVPPIHRFPSGCRFAPRCSLATETCTARSPDLLPLPGRPDHRVRCWVRGAVCARPGEESRS